MSDRERRRATRHPAKVPVKLRPAEGVTPYMFSADSLDVSESGLLFTLAQPLLVGTRIDITFVLPREVTGSLPMTVRCTARVVRVREGVPPHGNSEIAAEIERFETIVAEA